MITQEQIDEISIEVDAWANANPDEVKRIDDRCKARMLKEGLGDPETRVQRCMDSIDRLLVILDANK